MPTSATTDCMLLDPDELVAGERFRIRRKVGEGCFAVVYEAIQVTLDRRVALKILKPELLVDPTLVARFIQEAALAEHLSHPHIVRLIEHGNHEDTLYIAWEFLDGETLEDLLASEGQLGWPRIAHITGQVLKALMEAHSHGVVHRDIKPSNIHLSSPEGGRDFARVLDFGLAKMLFPSNDTQLTAMGSVMGTPAYMAAEQASGEPVGPAADLYALGLVMAECLTGRRVYDHGTPMQIVVNQASDDPVPLEPLVLASPIAPIITRATQKPLHLRYPSAREMLHDLERAVAGETEPGVTAIPSDTPPIAMRPMPDPVSTLDPQPTARSEKRRLPWALGILARILGRPLNR